jgi:Zn-finger protein
MMSLKSSCLRTSWALGFALAIVVTPWTVSEITATTKGMQGKVKPNDFTSARVCGECHQDIYKSWKNSLHAFSLVDPIFDAAYMQAVREAGDDARQNCLTCHAPMTMVNGDYDLSQGVSREGVSCDFCHTVTAVHLDGREKPYTVDPGIVNRGVIKKTASPAHEVAFSDLHSKSEFCGGCHNYYAPSGSAILGTYDEWKSGPYAREGVQCPNCHMILSSGNVVAESVKKGTTRIHLHSLVHDSNQLRTALSVQIHRAYRQGNELEVEVRVENIGSGHMIPTGMPTREVVLEMTAESGGHTRSQERRYRKVVADKKGRVLKSDYEVLLHGNRILNDNRLAPREVRSERFRFSASGAQPVKLEAKLFYRYSPAILDVKKMNIQLGKAEKLVR